MSVLASMLSMDDNMGLGTPNFFSSAWIPEQNDFSLTESYPADDGSYAGYAQSFQSQTEQDQIDYFSGHPKNRFRAQSYEFDSNLLDSNNGLNQFLDNPLGVKGILGTGISQDAGQPATTVQSLNPFEISNQIDPARALPTTLGDSTVLDPVDPEALSIDAWGLDVKSSPRAIRLDVRVVKNERKTSILHGQITPGDSPLEDRLLGKDSLKTTSSTEYIPKDLLASRKRKARTTASIIKKEPGDDANTVSKVKRPRKSKKKPLTKEQEEAKRKKFLERNRVAADKCRQNRKKWIDDLQAKAHFFTTDNAVKKAALEKLEHDISQLKALLLIHSGRCSDKNIATWLEQESTRVKKRTENTSEYIGDNIYRCLDDIMSPPSRSSSSHGFGNATSATNGEDNETSLSTCCDSSVKGSRRSSTASNGIAR
jgi:bZIP transcription factor